MTLSSPDRPILFGCPVDRLSLAEAVEWVDARIAAKRPARVGAVNAAKLVKLREDPVLAKAVTACELIIPDGMGVVFASPLLTGKRLQRVAGIDLMEALLARAAERGHRVYFLGAKPEVLERMLQNLASRHPKLRVAGQHHGYFSADQELAIVEAIRASEPDLVFIGMGTPAKELWIDRHHMKLGHAISMGVGGSFDVVAGLVQRAPRWMQGAGLEWLFRVLQEPRRLWRRYFSTNLVFVFGVVTGALRRPFRRP